MIFLHINEKKLTEMSLDELADFFTRNIFLKFMDSGRVGLRAGVVDLIDNVCQRSIDLAKTAKAKAARNEKLEGVFIKDIVNEYLMETTDGFILGGTGGIRHSVLRAFVDNRFYS